MTGRRLSREPALNVAVLVPDAVRVGIAPVEGRIIVEMVAIDDPDGSFRFSLDPECATVLASDVLVALDELAGWPRRDDA